MSQRDVLSTRRRRSTRLLTRRCVLSLFLSFFFSLSLSPSLFLARARSATPSYVAQREAKLREAFFVASISSGTGEHGPKAADLRWSLHGALLLALSFPPPFSFFLSLTLSPALSPSRSLARSRRLSLSVYTVSRFLFFFFLYLDFIFSRARFSPLGVFFRRDHEEKCAATAVTRVRYK